MSHLSTFFDELKARKVRKTMAIYVSSALTAIGVARLFIEVYSLPISIFTILVTILTFGVGSAFVFAWYHGREGQRKFWGRELLLHSLFLICAVTVSFQLISTRPVRLVSPDLKSIAVLPFTNMSESKEDEYFSDGITEDIITQLSKIADLRVISRTSVMKYKNTSMTMPDIARELDVGTVLEGSVRRAGGRVRITSQLIEARRDKHLWAETYDRQLKDIFAIQSEVAQKIAGALQATLSPLELEHIAKKPTENLDAYAFYLRGRDYFYHYNRNDNERAIELFKKALAIDSNYALAYAGLGDAYERRYYYDFPATWVDSAIVVSTRAIAIDPNLAEGYKALGSARQTKGELRVALDLFTKAVKLNPNYAPAINNIGYANWSLGAYDEAVKWMRRATVLQPGFARWTANVGFYYLHLGLDSLTQAWLEKAIELQPDYVFPYIVLAYHHSYRGRVDSARASIAKVLSLNPNEFLSLVAAGDVELLAGNYKAALRYYEQSVAIGGKTGESGTKLAYVLHKLGKEKEAKKLVKENLAAAARSPDEYPEGSSYPYLVATLYAWNADTAAAMRWLEGAIKLGYRDYRWISVDPQLENVRADERYTQVIASLKTSHEEMQKRALQDAIEE